MESANLPVEYCLNIILIQIMLVHKVVEHKGHQLQIHKFTEPLQFNNTGFYR